MGSQILLLKIFFCHDEYDCKVLVHHLRSQIYMYIPTLQQQSQQNLHYSMTVGIQNFQKEGMGGASVN